MMGIDYSNFAFTYKKTGLGSARLGSLKTPHGTLATPNFIFCATKAAIKSLPSYIVRELGVDIILSNTYHLLIQPGPDYIARYGGLHKFMDWSGPMLTDSGGYQVFAMGHGSVSAEIKKGPGRKLPKSLLKISEEAAFFRSYKDGSKIILSPEQSIEAQVKLAADLIMQFDECTPFHIDYKYTAEAMRRSLRWGDRCLVKLGEIGTAQQAMYGIVQGGIYADLRRESARRISEQNFFANAIGGSLGSSQKQMHDIVAMTASLLAQERPIHLLGIGDIPDIFWGIRNGIDTFDCVQPTRIARHGWAIVPAAIQAKRRINLLNAASAKTEEALDSSCKFPCCTRHSQAYLHHLFKAKELSASILLTMHNIGQMLRLLQDIRQVLRGSGDQELEFARLEKFWLG